MHIVLVHGAGGSAASWSLVTPLLEERGLTYSVADNLSQSLDDDVAAARALVDAAHGPALLVGHSYGGAVITNAGRHDRVRGLLYVAAFAPDEGESVQRIVNSYEAAEVSQYMRRGPDGEWMWGDDEQARAAVAWDIPDEIWERRLQDRRPSSDAIFTGLTGVPAWSLRPSWYLLATEDKHIRPETQRDMAVRAGATILEVPTSHAVPHAAPAAVAAAIEEMVATLTETAAEGAAR